MGALSRGGAYTRGGGTYKIVADIIKIHRLF